LSVGVPAGPPSEMVEFGALGAARKK